MLIYLKEEKHHNCVFIGKDKKGKIVFAYMWGSYDNMDRGFKRDVLSSNKSVAFWLPASSKSKKVFVFESPIDLMSHATLYGYPTTNAIAQCGLWDGPLETYLKENPHINDIILCLDNDVQCKNTVLQIREKYEERGYSAKERYPKPGKDWNETLQIHIKKSGK